MPVRPSRSFSARACFNKDSNASSSSALRAELTYTIVSSMFSEPPARRSVAARLNFPQSA